MDSSMALDFAGLGLTVVYLAVSLTVAFVAGPAEQDTTLRRLVLATQLAKVAVGVAVISFAVHAADTDDAMIWPLIWLFTSAMTVFWAVGLRRRRDTKGDQVVAEAEVTLRAYPEGNE